MNAEQYHRLSDPFRENPKLLKFLLTWNKISTMLFYVAYALLILLILRGPWINWAFLGYVVLAPGLGFGLVSLLRLIVNAPRPYEVLDIDPLIAKDKKGRSFPSKHTFSAFAIAICWCFWWLPGGIVLLLVALDVACIRVIGGVHFPRDVVVAALLGITFSLVGAFVLSYIPMPLTASSMAVF